MAPKALAAHIAGYPWSTAGAYRVWPGPNSNSFVAYVLRSVPDFGAEMDPTGIGKDYMGPGLRFGPTPSGTGWQISAWGVLGAAIARAEGLELHFLGATIDRTIAFRPARHPRRGRRRPPGA